MFLDTSVIVEILSGRHGNRARSEIFGAIGADPVYVSVIQYAELADACLAKGIEPGKAVAQIMDLASTVPLDSAIACEWARLKHLMRKAGAEKFGLVDGIVLASARSVGQRLLTMDSDFRKAEDAVVLGARAGRME